MEQIFDNEAAFIHANLILHAICLVGYLLARDCGD